MDNFIKLPTEERSKYFEESSRQIGLSPQMIEKDFWVSWVLSVLFGMKEIGEHLTFKGGTSLSKVYNIIKRFSEDIDISIERDYLGFGGDNEPEIAPSSKKKQQKIKELQNACRKMIASMIQPMLEENIFSKLQDGWKLELDKDDIDLQTLLFFYPVVKKEALDAYIRPAVKIEFGARSDHWPVESKMISSYVSQAFGKAFSDPNVAVRVLKVERTFWEKVTILHMLYHFPSKKKLPMRISRHYYDLARLYQSQFYKIAVKDIELLKRVIEHKSLYFRAAWAKYDQALPGTLKLIPKSERKSELKADYGRMEPMFFDTPEPFEKILEEIAMLEEEINSRKLLTTI